MNGLPSGTGFRRRIALVGIGKIARDQHLPVLAASEAFALVAVVSRHSALEGTPCFADLDALLRSGIEIDAVSLCTPPVGRWALARSAIEAGLHVMLEKPPAAAVSEIVDLSARAASADVSLFATWHSREAAGVEPARAWLEQRAIRSVHVVWREDIRVCHPGQHWILDAGGLGVFDPGINALSILTRILPQRLALQSATLQFPADRDAPIAGALLFLHGAAAPVHVELDFRESGPQRWDIEVVTDRGVLSLRDGGARLAIDGAVVAAAACHEYSALYAHFARLIADGVSDVDITPLQLVADAFMLGRRVQTGAFPF